MILYLLAKLCLTTQVLIFRKSRIKIIYFKRKITFYIIMISKILKQIGKRKILSQPTRYFCKNKTYFENKKQKQLQKTQTAFNHDQSKLKQLRINLDVLSPNFFTKTLPMKQGQKTIMPNKQANNVENSYVQLQIPISSDKQIRDSLIRMKSDQVRVGRILQCMDSIAGMVGYRHCFGSFSTPNPFVLVTGSVDSINLFQSIKINQDIKMEGYINWVGKTSMQVEINLYQSKVLKCNALFTMISRNALDHSKGYPCPKLIIDNIPQSQVKKARLRKSLAQQNVLKRKKQMMNSYKIKPPTAEDSALMHKIFLNSDQLSKQSVEIQKTIVTNIRLMHVQERNIHNKIFGGFLMRLMVETGWIVASQFAKTQWMHIQDITDVYFRAPVQIGCHLQVTGRVSYTRGNILVVTLQASTYNYHTDSPPKMCCQCQMFFRTDKQQKKVFPRSYENGIYYLTSRNVYNSAFPSSNQKKQ